MSVRTLSKAGCVLGVLICLVAVIAPTAYGNGVVDGTTEQVSAEVPEVPDVTQVTEAVPEVEEATTEVTEATAPVTQTAEQVATGSADAPDVDATSVPAPTSVQTSTTVAAPSTSGSVAAPDSSDVGVSSSGDGSTSTASSSNGGTTSDAGGTSTAPATGDSGYTSSSSVAASPQPGMRMPSFSGSAFGSFRRPQVAGAGGKPGDVLDDLLDIGNSIGVDQVRGLRITGARGDAESVGATEGSESPASTPAPLALTGIAIGAFLALGSILILVGSGARSAGRVSAA